MKFVVQGPFSKFQFGDECAHRMFSSGVSPSLSNTEALFLTRCALFVLVATHPLATNLLKLHKPRTFGLILARFGHVSTTSRPFAAFYSTNRIYSASLTRLHTRPASETPGYYRNHKLRYITGAAVLVQFSTTPNANMHTHVCSRAWKYIPAAVPTFIQ